MLPVRHDQDVSKESQWFRATDGLVAGVCQGVGRRLGVDPWLIRAAWLVSVLALGTGLLLYVVLAFCLPREDRLATAYDKRLLGVASRIARATGFEVGLVRTGVVLLGLASFGATVVGYFVLHFLIPDEPRPVAFR